jgi:hypothetical protein
MPDLAIPSLKHPPELDPGFLPASIWTQSFHEKCSSEGDREIRIAVIRPNGTGYLHRETILSSDDETSQTLNFRFIERVIKFLLWSCGGTKVVLEDSPALSSNTIVKEGSESLMPIIPNAFLVRPLSLNPVPLKAFLIPPSRAKKAPRLA